MLSAQSVEGEVQPLASWPVFESNEVCTAMPGHTAVGTCCSSVVTAAVAAI